MKVTVSIKNERGQELVRHYADVPMGGTLHIDGVEVREELTTSLPQMSTVLWLEGTIDVTVEKR